MATLVKISIQFASVVQSGLEQPGCLLERVSVSGLFRKAVYAEELASLACLKAATKPEVQRIGWALLLLTLSNLLC